MSVETIWAVAGLLLVIADVMFGTFFMLFLGLGALITAGLVWAGVWHESTAAQWLVFAGSSTLGVVLFRKRLIAAFGRDSEDKYVEHAGQTVTVSEDIPHNGIGRVKYKGAEWPARTKDGSALSAGHRARIDKTDGIVLEIEKE